MIFWTPSVLKCQIYEGSHLLDLNRIHTIVLQELVYSIYPLWKTSPEYSIWFDIEVYEKRSLFKEPTTTIEIQAYIRDINRPSGKKQVSINKANISSRVGRKFVIKPNDTALKRWKHPVEVMFVV